ncbi:MAG: threonine--tRNA ligase [Saprospiraceae bacterium]|nr:threonine--tRNA ligase [Saprospiraceae bacterium]
MIKITFPDGAVREFEKGIAALDIAKGISSGLAKKLLAAEVNGEVVDLTRPIETDAALNLLSWDDKGGQSTFWHSSAHLMAEAIEALYPGTKFGIGPAIESPKGFYYDIELPEGQKISTEDLPKIEKKMKELASKQNDFVRKEVSKADAVAYFKEKDDQYKLDLLEGLEDGEITFYTQGDFTDLCRGPHIPNTNKIQAIKLLNVAGAYWKGDENNQMMTRIYGVSFPKKDQLAHHLEMLEEAKKRDHRKLGAQLGIFMFSEKVGAGLPIWLPHGTALRTILEDFLKKEQLKQGYTPVITPHVGKKDLYVTSGHYEKYGEDSFQPIETPRENEEFFLKPMNCPHHCEVFAHMPRSFRDLPVRIAEFGTVYRYEQSGELHGLTRVRSFTVDDAHIFCTPDQLKEEFIDVLELIKMVISKLGFKDFTAQVSLRDPANKEKYIGSDENWDKAERMIQEAAAEVGLETVVETGEAAFYGPKLDFMIKDALGRSWQLGTVQVDYNLPERFELEYVGSDGQKHRPVMIHRAPFGSMERFIGVLIEHCAGNFPLWLAPEQVRVLPVAEKFLDYAKEVSKILKINDIRSTVDTRYERIGKLIRDAETQKVPFMLIVGEKEQEAETVNVRQHGKGDLGTISTTEFVEQIHKELQDN